MVQQSQSNLHNHLFFPPSFQNRHHTTPPPPPQLTTPPPTHHHQPTRCCAMHSRENLRELVYPWYITYYLTTTLLSPLRTASTFSQIQSKSSTPKHLSTEGLLKAAGRSFPLSLVLSLDHSGIIEPCWEWLSPAVSRVTTGLQRGQALPPTHPIPFSWAELPKQRQLIMGLLKRSMNRLILDTLQYPLTLVVRVLRLGILLPRFSYTLFSGNARAMWVGLLPHLCSRGIHYLTQYLASFFSYLYLRRSRSRLGARPRPLLSGLRLLATLLATLLAYPFETASVWHLAKAGLHSFSPAHSSHQHRSPAQEWGSPSVFAQGGWKSLYRGVEFALLANTLEFLVAEWARYRTADKLEETQLITQDPNPLQTN